MTQLAVVEDSMLAAKTSKLKELYTKFEPLAAKYAKQVYDADKIGFEFDDLVQEFRMKIYISIISYAAYYKKKKAGPYAPWPLVLYVKKALVNKKNDFIKQISSSPNKAYSVEQDHFDYSIFSSMEAHIKLSETECICEINGVDLLEGLNLLERKCFMLFLRGYTMQKLTRMFRKSIPGGATVMIERQVAMLQGKKSELLQNTIFQFRSHHTDPEN